MARTLAIFAVLILAVVAFLPKTRHAPVATPVSYGVSLAALRGVSPFPVYAPTSSPPGWTANHATTHVPTAADPSTSLDLGFYISSGQHYAAVEQSDKTGFTRTQLGAGGRQTGTEVVAGTTWQTWVDGSGHPALLRSVGSSTLILDGVATSPELQTLAAALSLAPASQGT